MVKNLKKIMVQLQRDMRARKSSTSFTARVAPINNVKMSLSGIKFIHSPVLSVLGSRSPLHAKKAVPSEATAFRLHCFSITYPTILYCIFP
jgi:hypothetical protein